MNALTSIAPAPIVGKPDTFRISPFQSDLLDLSRWVAAFLVVIEHLRSFMFVSHRSEDHFGLFWKAFYFLTGFGHSAVMVFFVMSGFLVGGKVLERLANGNFSWRKYAVDRTSRLYAVYVMALLLGAAFDYVGYHYMNRFGLYDRSFPGTIAVVNHDFHANLKPSIFGLNLAMCQTILGPVFGSNGPLWSLANEFWYYLAGPLLFALFFARTWGTALLGIGALAALFCFLPAAILLYFPVWLLGAALCFVNTRPLLPLWFALLLFLVSFSAARLQWLKVPYIADMLIGISFALVVNSAAGSPRRFPWHTLSRKAADFSYSVYLCHVPFLVFALSALYQATGRGLQEPRTIPFISLFLLMLLLAYAWCYIVSLATERQTGRIRKRLHGLSGREAVSQLDTVQQSR
jgi:peptidoglycan/LPS O-acetylase OafA/YrhL